jgi:hypothetical protein
MVLVTGANALLNAALIPIWSYWAALAVAVGSEGLLLVLLQVGCHRFVLRVPSVSENDGRAEHVQ